ncbi:hypothetical protein EJ03DRAFT_73442 [Teratosphaeria nubilosa]|uniref:Uncharacterized protein n=1 Tax=Teratosphaeria nubilosa TaxID=161662 RepID=A0A6G1LM00_9PEZI|nr:hypothetical protein EJ03DRAFT_73442 [Teratosphaeria nubilosa]
MISIRAQINVVSHALLALGTIRANLDPFAGPTDKDISDALSKVWLVNFVHSQGGPNAVLKPDAWSSGQMQLLCFARALLARRAMVSLDETTSKCDVALPKCLVSAC